MDRIAEIRNTINELTTEVRSKMAAKDMKTADEKMEEIRSLNKELQMEIELAAEEKRSLENQAEERKEVKSMETRTNKKDLELRALRKVLLRQDLDQEERKAITTENGAAILPQGFVNEIETLREGYPALKNYVHVVPVTTNTGKAPISKGSETKKLADLKHDKAMTEEMLTLDGIEYAVDDYGKIIPVENSVIEDTTTNFMDAINIDFAECSVNTENEKIVKVLDELVTESKIKDYKGVQKALTGLAPLPRSRAIVITNTTGYAYLDELEDKNGRPLLKMLDDGSRVIFKGKEVIEVETEVETPVFYVVDPKIIKFMDRKRYEVAISKEAGFVLNQTFIKVLERFDVKTSLNKTDKNISKFIKKLVIDNTAEVK